MKCRQYKGVGRWISFDWRKLKLLTVLLLESGRYLSITLQIRGQKIITNASFSLLFWSQSDRISHRSDLRASADGSFVWRNELSCSFMEECGGPCHQSCGPYYSSEIVNNSTSLYCNLQSASLTDQDVGRMNLESAFKQLLDDENKQKKLLCFSDTSMQ